MSLIQYKTFSNPLYKVGTNPLNPVVIAVGDTATLIQRDHTLVSVVVAEVLDGPSKYGQRIGWAITNGQPRSEDIIGAGGVHQYICPNYDYEYDTYDTPPNEPDYTVPSYDIDLGPDIGDTLK